MTAPKGYWIDFDLAFPWRMQRLRAEIVLLCLGLCAIAELRNFCRSIRAMGRDPRHE